MPEDQSLPKEGGYRIIVCDYTTLMQSVCGVLRMAGYRVFQGYDALAVEELCVQLPEIDLLILDTFGAGPDASGLTRRVRSRRPDLPILHIAKQTPTGLPTDVLTLAEDFTATSLLSGGESPLSDRCRLRLTRLKASDGESTRSKENHSLG